MSDRAGSSDTTYWGDADDAEALQRYRTLAHSIDEGVYQLDAEGRFVAVNDVLLDLSECAREDLLGEHVSVLFDDADASTVEREIDRRRTNPTERGDLLDLTVQTAEGDRVRCELRVSPLETDDTVQGTVGIVRDVTGRNRTEALGEHERQRERKLERYERIIENLPVGVYRNTTGGDGEFVEGNSTLASIFDADSVEELQEHTVSDLYTDPDQRAEFSRRLEREGKVEGFELEQETLDGDTIWISVTAIRTEEDGEVYFDGVVQDVTRERRREQELEARSAAMEESIDGIAILDENEEYVFVNQAHADIYGYDDPEALRGETWRSCYDDEELARLESEAMPALAERGSWRGEATGTRKDGSTFPQELSLTVLDDGRYVCVVRNVTERAERERELKRYETLFTESRDVNGVLDPDGTFRYVTPSAAGILGYEPEELVGADAFDYVHPEDRDRVAETYAEMVENPQQEPTVEYRFEHADGSWIVLESRGRNLLDDPEIGGIVVYSRDVTERRERERTLEQHERIVETIDDGVYAIDADSKFVMVNDAFCEMVGREREALLGRHATTVYDDEIAPVAAEKAAEVTAGDSEQATLELDLHTKDGETVPVESRFGPFPYEDGVGRCGVVRDISDRLERERALEESERRYRTLAENFPNGGVGVYDEDLRYTLVTGTMWDDIDPDASDIEDNTIWEALPPETADDVEPLFRDALDGETGSVVSTLGGRTYRVWATPLRDAEGKITGGQSFALDIDDRIRREQRLEELVDELEESNERLEQFAYAVSHDLREPLRMVSSYLQMIERRYADELDDDGEEFIEFAVDGSERMREMIEGLLEYSRVDTHGDPFEPVDLSTVLADVRDDLQVQIEETDAEVTTGELPHVEGDASQLRQLFQNLLDNAIEYSGDEPPQVDVAAERAGSEWVVSVSDGGIGIDPDDADRVFEVFQSLHTDDEHPGTGIGLALCERIADRHGGDIWVESELGEGATFSFTLPAEGERGE